MFVTHPSTHAPYHFLHTAADFRYSILLIRQREMFEQQKSVVKMSVNALVAQRESARLKICRSLVRHRSGAFIFDSSLFLSPPLSRSSFAPLFFFFDLLCWIIFLHFSWSFYFYFFFFFFFFMNWIKLNLIWLGWVDWIGFDFSSLGRRRRIELITPACLELSLHFGWVVKWDRVLLIKCWRSWVQVRSGIERHKDREIDR